MGERVWRYTVKGFEMPPLCDEMPPFQMLSPARDISFHPQATSLSSTGDFAFIYRRPSFHPRNSCVVLAEEPDWCKARPICRLRASRFAIGGGTYATRETSGTFSSSGIGLGEAW